MGRIFSKPKIIGNSGVPRVEVKLFGDWEKTIRLMQGLDPKIKAASIKAQLKVANQILKSVKAHLRNQDLGWQRLNPRYAELKSKKGRDSRTLISATTYYNNIKVWQKGAQHLVFIGVRKGIYTYDLNNKRSKVEVATIAAFHEFSSGRRFPKRPLWNPTIQELGGIKGIKKMYLNSLKFWLRSMGVPVVETISTLGWR